MKIRILLGLSVLWAGAANAQLDSILAPLPPVLDLARHEQAPAEQGMSKQAASPAAADTHRDLAGDEVLGEIQKQLVTYFGIKGDLKLSFVNDWRPVRMPAKDFELTLIDYPAQGVTASLTLRFKITSGGVPVGEWQSGLRAQLWQSVWVTQGRLDRGQPLDPAMLTAQKIDVLREQQTFLSDDVDPSGYDVAQGIGAGKPVGKQDVIERPLVHRGDVVEVIATEGLLDIHMKALALEDGGRNALIKMRNLDSSKNFNAQILNENEVKVHF